MEASALDSHRSALQKIQSLVMIALENTENQKYEQLQTLLSAIKKLVDEIVFNTENVPTAQDLGKEQPVEDTTEASFYVDIKDLQNNNWQSLGEGHFGKVYKAKLKGCPVAVKILKEASDKTRLANQEGKLLRHLNHDNIIAYRGMGRMTETKNNISKDYFFIVMEYMNHSIETYVQRQNTYEREGLPKKLVWRFGKQIANGLAYLHTLSPPLHPVAHRDLKPDNILLDQVKMKIKLADFGIAFSQLSGDDERYTCNPRWCPPEIFKNLDRGYFSGMSGSSWGGHSSAYGESEDETDRDEPPNDNSLERQESTSSQRDLGFYLRADVFSYGAVVAYCLTGLRPWSAKKETGSIGHIGTWDAERAKIKLPSSLEETDPLRQLIEHCYADDPSARPSCAADVIENHFLGTKNPYKFITSKAEFFHCGFLRDTYIFVADSLVDEMTAGYLEAGLVPRGYPKDCLLCPVDVRTESWDYIPPEIQINDMSTMSNVTSIDSRASVTQWDHHELYHERLAHFYEEANKKHIENNPTVQLKSIKLLREGEGEEQSLCLEFVQGTYVHHRAMRDVWMSLSDREKERSLSYKGDVHPIFSTSFGLHVAVITADNKYFFCRRANQRGISSPKSYTCGAVETGSVKDFIIDNDGVTRVSLLKTAARGLMEELRVELIGEEIDAICLSTIYLKFDTHEWGMCGFVNLSDKRISPERRLTCEQLQSRFVTGPKDKFEHDLVEAVDFNLESMVDFVHNNRDDFASSGKLVVVKVLQSFFGVTKVEHAFRAFDN